MKTHITSLISRTPLLLASAGSAIALLASAPSPATAHEAPITCGTVVITDVRLSADLVDCAGTGLVIGAPGVTIDLAGHRIDGTGSGAGIDNSAGHDDVRLTGGTVREFLFGVHLFQASGRRLDRLVVETNINGVIIERSDGVEVDRVTASDNVATGVDIGFSDGIVVRGSVAAGNGLYGIFDRGSTEGSYVRNTVIGNAAPGLALWFSDRTLVDRNHAAANESDGIQLVGVEDTVVRRNSAEANHGIGIAAAEAEGVIDGGRNHARGNLGGDCSGIVCR
jgi:nitrous oxidase accessory protein NosD